jgi:hypothetical protein
MSSSDDEEEESTRIQVAGITEDDVDDWDALVDDGILNILLENDAEVDAFLVRMANAQINWVKLWLHDDFTPNWSQSACDKFFAWVAALKSPDPDDPVPYVNITEIVTPMVFNSMCAARIPYVYDAEVQVSTEEEEAAFAECLVNMPATSLPPRELRIVFQGEAKGRVLIPAVGVQSRITSFDFEFSFFQGRDLPFGAMQALAESGAEGKEPLGLKVRFKDDVGNQHMQVVAFVEHVALHGGGRLEFLHAHCTHPEWSPRNVERIRAAMGKNTTTPRILINYINSDDNYDLSDAYESNRLGRAAALGDIAAHKAGAMVHSTAARRTLEFLGTPEMLPAVADVAQRTSTALALKRNAEKEVERARREMARVRKEYEEAMERARAANARYEESIKKPRPDAGAGFRCAKCGGVRIP